MEAEVIHVDESPRSSSTFLVRSASTVSPSSWSPAPSLTENIPTFKRRGGESSVVILEQILVFPCLKYGYELFQLIFRWMSAGV